MIGLGNPLWIVAGFAAGLAIGGYIGRDWTNTAWEAETLQTTVEVLKNRGAIDEEISGMPRDILCTRLGGLWNADERKCVQRVEAVNP